MADTLTMWRRLSRIPGGTWFFSRMVWRRAPYFRTIRPRIQVVEPGHAEVFVPKRRAVENHIKTLHVIAAINGLEVAMGVAAEATVPRDMRWIPKGMEVSYVAKATTDLICTADTDAADWRQPGDVPVRLTATRTDGTVAIEGTIHVYVSARPAAKGQPE